MQNKTKLLVWLVLVKIVRKTIQKKKLERDTSYM